MPTPVTKLASIADDFDLFLIDQFGVLHNGVEPYPHAVDALKQLKHRNKRIVIVSNSGKRSEINKRRLKALGFSESLYDHFITSGEVAFRQLQHRFKKSSGRACFLIARDNDVSAVEGLHLHQVESVDKADLIVISGSEAERYSENDYRDILRPAAKQKISCICTNPDKKMLTNDGIKFGAGRIATLYEELGGTVDWIGKPFAPIYQHVLDLYTDCDRARTLCIGDSIEHDIAGGHNVGLKTLLVKTGILTDVPAEQIQMQFQQHNVSPDYIAPELIY